MSDENDFGIEDELEEYEYDDEPIGDEEEDEGPNDSPWSWADEVGAKPEDVKKTWTQYTQTREEVLAEKREAERMRRELEPIAALRDEIYQDPALVQLLDNYMQNGRPAEREVVSLKQDLENLRSQYATDAEYNELSGWIQEHDEEPVGKKEILSYAIENNIGNLQAAYKSMMYEKAKEKAVGKVVDGIKRSRGAKSLKTRKPDTPRSRITTADIAKMSEDEFISNYDEIVRQYNEGK